MTRIAIGDATAEMLKALRSGPCSQDDAAEASGMDPRAASLVLKQWEQQGIVTSAQVGNAHGRGARVRVYELAPAWRGGA